MRKSPFFPNEPFQEKDALQKHAVYIDRMLNDEIELESDPEIYQEIFEYFQEDMPIGVQKYRTGDADQWIFSRLELLSRVPY